MKINMREVMEAKNKITSSRNKLQAEINRAKVIGKQSKEAMLYLEKSKQLLMVKLVITNYRC